MRYTSCARHTKIVYFYLLLKDFVNIYDINIFITILIVIEIVNIIEISFFYLIGNLHRFLEIENTYVV